MPFCSQLTKILERLEPTNRQCEEALVPTVWSGGGTAGRSPEGTGGGRASAPGAKPRYSCGWQARRETQAPEMGSGSWKAALTGNRKTENSKHLVHRPDVDAARGDRVLCTTSSRLLPSHFPGHGLKATVPGRFAVTAWLHAPPFPYHSSHWLYLQPLGSRQTTCPTRAGLPALRPCPQGLAQSSALGRRSLDI